MVECVAGLSPLSQGCGWSEPHKEHVGQREKQGENWTMVDQNTKKTLLTTFKSVKWISHHILRWARICSPELCRGWLLLKGTWSWWTLNGQFPSWQDQLDHDQPPDGEGEGEPDGDGVDHHREVGVEQQEDSPPKWVLKQVTKLHWETELRKRKGNGK